MARKPEATFRTSVHKHLPDKSLLHREPGGSPYASGTPDTYYEGPASHLRVEWKYWPVVPPKFNLSTPVMKSHKVKLSELQLQWVNRACNNCQPIAVICGSPKGGIIMIEREWTCDITREIFNKNLLIRQEIAEWIMRVCCSQAGLNSVLRLLP